MNRFQYFDLPKQFLVHAKYVTRQPHPVKGFSTLDLVFFNIFILSLLTCFLFFSFILCACVLISISFGDSAQLPSHFEFVNTYKRKKTNGNTIIKVNWHSWNMTKKSTVNRETNHLFVFVFSSSTSSPSLMMMLMLNEKVYFYSKMRWKNLS